MLESAVGQAADTRQRLCAGIGHTVDCQHIQIGEGRVFPVGGARLDASFGRAAQMFKHAQAARPKALLAQQCRDGGRAAGVIAQYQQAYTTVQVGVEGSEGTRHHR